MGSNILLIKDKLELMTVERWHELIAQEHLDNSLWIYCLNEWEGGGRSREFVSNKVWMWAVHRILLLWVVPLDSLLEWPSVGWHSCALTHLADLLELLLLPQLLIVRNNVREVFLMLPAQFGMWIHLNALMLFWAPWFPVKGLCRKLVMFGCGNLLNASEMVMAGAWK